MNIYFTYRDEIVFTSSSAQESIENRDMSRIRVPWFRIAKEQKQYQVEEFSGLGEVGIVAISDNPKKLVPPMFRRMRAQYMGFRFSDEEMSLLREWLDRQKKV